MDISCNEKNAQIISTNLSTNRKLLHFRRNSTISHAIAILYCFHVKTDTRAVAGITNFEASWKYEKHANKFILPNAINRFTLSDIKRCYILPDTFYITFHFHRLK